MIALLTDFGTTDPYVGIMKGVIFARAPQCTVVDITHGVAPFCISEAAYFLESSHRYFPHGTVFCCVVDPGVGTTRRALAVQTQHYYFVAPDNGLLSMVLQHEQPLCVVELNNSAVWLRNVSATFHGRDIFAPAAALLAVGTPVESLGEYYTRKLIEAEGTSPLALPAGWQGTVLSIDHFGNIITNFTREHLGTGAIKIQIGKQCITTVQRTFADGAQGQALAYIGSSGYVELALNNDNAARVWGIQHGDTVLLETV